MNNKMGRHEVLLLMIIISVAALQNVVAKGAGLQYELQRWKIFDAMMEFTLNMGMANASSAILHCDKFHALFPIKSNNNNMMGCNWTDIKIMKDFRTTLFELLTAPVMLGLRSSICCGQRSSLFGWDIPFVKAMEKEQTNGLYTWSVVGGVTHYLTASIDLQPTLEVVLSL